jgi:hypothetical protein
MEKIGVADLPLIVTSGQVYSFQADNHSPQRNRCNCLKFVHQKLPLTAVQK